MEVRYPARLMATAATLWRSSPILYSKWLNGLDGVGVVPRPPVAKYVEGS
ncbi:hypothetical protein [Actinosynnema sp. ALI-1.44]|nr:hypothetical protein [Actinosynnema sp. ALI-1.44]